MFQLSLIFSHFLVKLLALKQLTWTLMLSLIMLLMASGEEDLSNLFLMLEFLTLMHHQILHLSLIIAALRRRRDINMSSMDVRLSMAILLHLVSIQLEEWVVLPAIQVYKRLDNLFTEKLDLC